MNITEIVLVGFPGAYSVIDPSLAYTVPIKICRDNKEFDIVSTTPGNRQARYVAAEGRVTFADPFTSAPVIGPPGSTGGVEKVYVKFKF